MEVHVVYLYVTMVGKKLEAVQHILILEIAVMMTMVNLELFLAALVMKSFWKSDRSKAMHLPVGRNLVWLILPLSFSILDVFTGMKRKIPGVLMDVRSDDYALLLDASIPVRTLLVPILRHISYLTMPVKSLRLSFFCTK